MEARFAELLAAYCLEAQSGETVLVEVETPALPLLPHLKRTLSLPAHAVPPCCADSGLYGCFKSLSEYQHSTCTCYRDPSA